MKITGRIVKYEDNNVVILGHSYFIPTPDLKTAMSNFPAGTIVTLATAPKQKGTVQGMAEPTTAELKSFQNDEKVRAFQEGMNSKDPAKFVTGKEILQQNLDRAAELKAQSPPVQPPEPLKETSQAKIACYKPALCPKGCDGKKDPCQFKPKQPSSSPAPTTPPKSTETPKKPLPAPAQTPPIDPSMKELFTDLANTDPKVFEIIKTHEPKLWDAFLNKTRSIGEDPTRKKGPVERGEFPTPDELLGMVYNYDSYWKAKTILDLIARRDIRQQVEFKNRLECVSLALSTKPKNRDETFGMAWDIYTTITQKIQEDQLLEQVDAIEKTGEFVPLDQAAKDLDVGKKVK